MPSHVKGFCLNILVAVWGILGPIAVAPYAHSSDFGNLGIIKVPSARFSPDASLIATLSFDGVADIYNISYQATPWLEGTFRYAIFDPRRDRSKARDRSRDRSREPLERLRGSL